MAEKMEPKRPRPDDDDLWSNRFTPSSHRKSEGEEKPKEISDGLQEMLAHTMCEHFKSPTESQLKLFVGRDDFLGFSLFCQLAVCWFLVKCQLLL